MWGKYNKITIFSGILFLLSLPRGEEQNYHFFNMSVGGGVSLQRASQEPHKGARSARQILIAVAAAAAASFRSSLSQQPLAAASGSSFHSSLWHKPLTTISRGGRRRRRRRRKRRRRRVKGEGRRTARFHEKHQLRALLLFL